MSKWFRVNQDNEYELFINVDKTISVFQEEDRWYIIDERGTKYKIDLFRLDADTTIPAICTESAIFGIDNVGINQDPTS